MKILSIVLVAVLGSAALVAQQNPPFPQIPNLAGKVLTVLGPVDPATLGITLMHEHIFIEFQNPNPKPPHFANAEDAAYYEQPLTLATLARARDRGSVRARNYIGDFDESYKEVMEFKKWGGQTIVDPTNLGLGRDPRALFQMANATGLNIVMGSGWYQKAYHPLDMDSRSVEDLTNVIVRDIVVGAQGTGIRSGIIGEVGVEGRPLTPNELKSIRASARASRLTGAPITFHRAGMDEEKFRVLDIVEEEGVDLSHVVLSHTNQYAHNIPYLKRLLARGVVIEFDFLGSIGGTSAVLGERDDSVVARAVAELVKQGFASQIVLSHDICTKPQLKTYGGTGYSYISEYFLPALTRLGVSDDAIHTMMVANPQRILTFVAPQQMATTATTKR